MTADLPAAVRTSAIEIGADFAGWRKILGPTAEQVADRAGVTRVTLRKVEHGDPSVGFHVVLRVARALGVLSTLTEALDPLKTDLVARALISSCDSASDDRPRLFLTGVADVGYLSALALLERRDGDGGDDVDLAERIPETSIRASDDARQLFRRAAVNVGLNNTDDRLRNHGFIRDGPGWTLSPAFDINPDPEPSRRQTSIAGADSPADQAEGLVVLAEQCRLAPEEFRAELLAVSEALSGWQDAARSNGARPGEITRLQESFDTGLRTLRDAAR